MDIDALNVGGCFPRIPLRSAGNKQCSDFVQRRAQPFGCAAALFIPQTHGNLKSLSRVDNALNYWSAKIDVCDRRRIVDAFASFADWLYVEDHARALDVIVQRGRIGEKYNVGGERCNIDVVRRICVLLDRLRLIGRPYEEFVTFVADRPGHDLRYAIDATKLERELGWRALETFDSGIEKTVRWYLDNEWWWRPLRDKVYAGERLGVLPEEMRRTSDKRAGASASASIGN